MEYSIDEDDDLFCGPYPVGYVTDFLGDDEEEKIAQISYDKGDFSLSEQMDLDVWLPAMKIWLENQGFRVEETVYENHFEDEEF